MTLHPILKALRAVVLAERRVRNGLTFRARFGFAPPPHWSDLSGYERLLSVILREGLCRVPGDFVEIGAFLGGGTYKLANLLAIHAPEKKLYTIDVFQAARDPTRCTAGDSMAEIYARALRGRDQWTIYKELTRDCANLVTIVGDSAAIELPCQSIAFGYVDGNHDPAYVRSDFHLVWDRLSPGGIVAFDDYGFDLPEVTRTIDALTKEHAPSIARKWKSGWKTYFVQKRRA